jgi:hypothetical protein
VANREDPTASSCTEDGPPPGTIYPTLVELWHYEVVNPINADAARSATVPVHVVTNDQQHFVVLKTYNDFFQLHRKVIIVLSRVCIFKLQLLDRYPIIAGCHGNRRVIPYLPGRAMDEIMTDENYFRVWKLQMGEVSDYV